MIYGRQGKDEQALTYYQQSLAIAQESENRRGEGDTLNNIGMIYYSQGKAEQALTYYQQSLAIAQESKNHSGIAEVATKLGIIYFEQLKDVEKAIPLLMRAYNLSKEMGSSDADEPESYLNDIKEQIGEERFDEIIQSNQTNSQS